MSDTPEGREALVHLRVPVATKARWVRASRALGMTLGDWIIERIERSERPAMNVYKVPDTLSHKYHGAGHALAVTVNGQLIDIVYLADVLPDLDLEDDVSGEPIEVLVTDARLGPTVRRLQALGQVHAGMLSCWEFCEL